MLFLRPWFLLLLILVPLLAAGYRLALRRRRKVVVRYASLSLLRAAVPARARRRRHVPPALFLLALTALVVGFARPTALVAVPLSRTTIILALDVSRSMCATDVEPNRLTIAQEAALAFVDDQVEGTQVGIVAFAGFAELVVPPTTDKERLRAAIAGFTTSFGTAIGSATLKALDAIAAINPDVAPSGVPVDAVTAAVDGYQPDIIVLLTDGANSQGPEPLDAAQQAVDRRVRVYTIGFGTEEPTSIVCAPSQQGVEAFGGGFGGRFGGGGGGGGGNFRRFLVIDEPTLQGIADMTGGDYYRAETAQQLRAVFRDLPAEIVLQKESVDVSAALALLGALLTVAAVGLSQLWRPLP